MFECITKKRLLINQILSWQQAFYYIIDVYGSESEKNGNKVDFNQLVNS